VGNLKPKKYSCEKSDLKKARTEDDSQNNAVHGFRTGISMQSVSFYRKRRAFAS
jgi:hypothetical protein